MPWLGRPSDTLYYITLVYSPSNLSLDYLACSSLTNYTLRRNPAPIRPLILSGEKKEWGEKGERNPEKEGARRRKGERGER